MAERHWQPPRYHSPHTREEDEDRKVGWLELFYDLVFVAAIVQLGNVLSADVSLAGVARFAALFVPIWWAWTGVTFYANRFEVDDIWHRLLVFVQMFAIGNMGITVSDAFGKSSGQFALCYVVVRAVLVVQYLRARRHVVEARPLATRYSAGFALAAGFWLASVFVPPPVRFWLWAAGVLADFAVPLSPGSRRLAARFPPDLPHMSERYGLFTIIVLGEGFLKMINDLAGEPLTLPGQVIGALTFVIVGSLWWTYFDDVAGAQIKPATRLGNGPAVWLYAHLPLAIGIVGVGVGTTKIVALPFDGVLAPYYRWLFCGSLALALCAIAALDLATVRTDTIADSRSRARARIGGAVLLIALAAGGGALPFLVLIVLIALICASQVLFDLRMEAHAKRNTTASNALQPTDPA